jgi:hypothetical protein
MDGSVSLADLRVFVIDEDLWRDVELVPASYGHCVGAEVVVLGLHRSGRRREMPAATAGLADLMRQFSLDLIVWPYAERISDVASLDDWYRSGRACSKMPW